MKKEVSRLVLYHELEKDPILRTFSEVEEAVRGQEPFRKEQQVDRIYDAIRQLLEIATSYAFDKNLWRDYLSFLLITNENPFSLTAEKQGIEDGSVRHFAHQDMEVFCRLFTYDFTGLEEILQIDCFSVITSYRSIPKRAQNFP